MSALLSCSGIPDIEPIDIGGTHKRPSKKNLALLWSEQRDTKPDYENIEMKRVGVPKNYKDKNDRRIARLQKEARKKEHEKLMKSDRKKERSDARKAQKTLKHEIKMKKIEKKRPGRRTGTRKKTEERKRKK